MATVSLQSVPALQSSRKKEKLAAIIAAKIWKTIDRTGHYQNPPVALGSLFSFIYLAWCHRKSAQRKVFQLYIAAAVLTTAMVPYTILTIRLANNRLLDIAEEQAQSQEKDSFSASSSDDEIDRLLEVWRQRNLIRSFFPLMGSTAGILALLSRIKELQT
ncbi:hypothetical protein LTR05_007370 [Lithohypha guttulata]|uniref:Uncharacterized protein n=1 Tax=Lithohypha guttulata TaxID=1690604 RepID=A0AAN7YDP4_9EURO|nr:hypothetical protein LTR05_007370 [Lithohypha guttulata]